MEETIVSVNTLPELLFQRIRSEKVKISEANGGIFLMPVDESAEPKKDCRSLRGLTAGSGLTVEKFLEMKREDKALEMEKEKRLWGE